jgi:hypothetical protein
MFTSLTNSIKQKKASEGEAIRLSPKPKSSFGVPLPMSLTSVSFRQSYSFFSGFGQSRI